MTNQTTAASNVAEILRPRNTDLVDETEAAEILDLAPGTLSVWRSTGRYAEAAATLKEDDAGRAAVDQWVTIE